MSKWVSAMTPNGEKIGFRIITKQSDVDEAPAFYTGVRPATEEEIERELSDRAGKTKRESAPNPWEGRY
jgi:signal recognition particle GTPase